MRVCLVTALMSSEHTEGSLGAGCAALSCFRAGWVTSREQGSQVTPDQLVLCLH